MFFNIRDRSFPIQNYRIWVLALAFTLSHSARARGSHGPKKPTGTTVSTDPSQGAQMSSDNPADLQKAGTMAAKTPKAPDPDVKDGTRLKDYATVLKAVFPDATDFKESPLLPLEYGGSTFTGLVARQLGEGASREYEGLKTRRYIYYAVNKAGSTLGIVHGSSIEAQGKVLDVYVYYTPGGTVQQVKVDGLPPATLKDLTTGSFLSQFSGRTTSEFMVTRGKKGRIKSKGSFLREAHAPSSKNDDRSYFDKILRAVRYNTAFMDVAYFITQHPDAADKPINEFPQEVEVTSGKATSGPEAFIRSKKISGSPVDGKMTMGHDDKAPAAAVDDKTAAAADDEGDADSEDDSGDEAAPAAADHAQPR